jgi:hypothetical protein
VSASSGPLVWVDNSASGFINTMLHSNTVSRVLECDYRRGMDWWMDLLNTAIHHAVSHVIDHWHTQKSVLSILQSPLAVSWQRLLPREILQLPCFRSPCHGRLCRTLVN